LQRDFDGLEDKVLTDAPDEGDEVEVAAGAFKENVNAWRQRVCGEKGRQ